MSYFCKKHITTKLSKISIVLPVISGIFIIAFLAYIGGAQNISEHINRDVADVAVVEDYNYLEVESEDAPIGIIKEYTFNVSETMGKDTYLAFYTVHQYAEVYVDNQLIYSMKPSGISFIKTIGSNWSMIPVYREDAGKEICVKIIPAYESFRNRQVEFLIGSRLDIFMNRLKKDWPQLILSALTICVGMAFVIIALYKRFNERDDEGLAALGLFSAMLGVWRLTDTRFTPFLAPDKPVLMFYISLSMMMIGIIPLIKSMEKRFNKKSRFILDCYCIAASVLCIVQLVLQLFCGVDFRETIVVTHALIGAGAVLVLANVFYDRAKNNCIHGDMLAKKGYIGYLILIIGVLADILTFYIIKTSSGLLFTLMAMLVYIILTGINMMFHYVEQERQLTESRISTMISQIKPHFIYNTLGSIEQLCEIQPEEAAKLVHNFAHYLRGNFSELDNYAPILLSKEIEHTRYYVSIEQVRFPDMKIKFDLKSSDFLIPALSVQPLVENSIKHGLMKLTKGGMVTVSSYETESDYCVEVSDNGAGFNTSVLIDEREHVGLRNIRGRVEAMCGGTLIVESKPGTGTKVTISIPKEARG